MTTPELPDVHDVLDAEPQADVSLIDTALRFALDRQQILTTAVNVLWELAGNASGRLLQGTAATQAVRVVHSELYRHSQRTSREILMLAALSTDPALTGRAYSSELSWYANPTSSIMHLLTVTGQTPGSYRSDVRERFAAEISERLGEIGVPAQAERAVTDQPARWMGAAQQGRLGYVLVPLVAARGTRMVLGELRQVMRAFADSYEGVFDDGPVAAALAVLISTVGEAERDRLAQLLADPVGAKPATRQSVHALQVAWYDELVARAGSLGEYTRNMVLAESAVSLGVAAQ